MMHDVHDLSKSRLESINFFPESETNATFMHEKQKDSQNGTSDCCGQIKVLYPDSINLFGWKIRAKWNFGSQKLP